MVAALLLAAGSGTIRGGASAQDAVGVASRWIVDSQPERAYGWLEGEPDSEFSAVVGVVRGPNESIAVADQTFATITILAVDGSVLATMGRAGDGPGEFRTLAGIVASGEGRVVAFDRQHQRLSEWTFDGSLSDDARLSRTGAARRIGEVGRFADGSWFAREGDRIVAADPGGVGRDTVGFHRLDQHGVVGEVLARVPGSLSSQFVVDGMSGMRGALFSPRALSAVRGNCLLLAAGDEPVVQIFHQTGTRRGELRLDIPVDRVTEEHRERWVAASVAAAGRAMGGEIVPEAARMIEVMGEAVGMAERVPFANDLIVDELGYIWVQSWQLPDGPGSPEWRVFAETGRGIGTVRLPEGLRVLDISAEALTAVRTDELGRQFVQVHALERHEALEILPLPSGCG